MNSVPSENLKYGSVTGRLGQTRRNGKEIKENHVWYVSAGQRNIRMKAMKPDEGPSQQARWENDSGLS